ncbi:hypothetical protein N7492_006092 [Penicillium capsulatum]|uniref:Uncharacterized protein n=1 Tax=Penicillium capsulatum TaxID=69766 RepID=A0A9W9I288_9EURO|nr:hypothetical protein N7492_006092 [Penicillium capsulatum]KAJ6108742.1 hypothetical protein N7512_008579 [Penicillium capsulatum]
MAIWPFGRKNKRHTIQVSPTEAATLDSIDHPDPPAPEPTLSRKTSKRRSSRLSRSGDGSESIRGSTRPSSHRPISSIEPRILETRFDHGEAEAAQPPFSRRGSLSKKQPSNGPNKLRRRLSKRKANEIMREREIRMLSSTPIDIPRRVGATAVGGDYLLEHRRRRANGRRADRYHSDISLSMRNSAASSMSDVSDPYTFKVNAFAALTPRPVVRYVEAPRLATAKSQNPPDSARQDRRKLQAATMSQEELYYSKRRVNELADSLDAGALRELLDRDRRRRVKQETDDQEKLRQKLQEQADAQEAQEAQQAQDPHPEAPVETQQNELKEEPAEAEVQPPAVVADQPAPQWPLVESEEPAERESVESTRPVGPMDDSTIPKLAPRSSFAPSHEPAISRTTLSPSHSSLRHGLSSPSHSQTFGMGSTSDLSDRRPSDTSGRRGGSAITSLFRRGSSRLKRTYRERFQDSSPDVSNNVSHESFYKIQTQASPPVPSVIPPRSLVPTGTVKRSQSKFTEHFGDEPMSPPESRLQSPDIPEEVPESSHENEENPAIHAPTPSAGVDIVNPRRRRHQSWTESCDAESDNVPLSQSLASIDSEGSWMSGQYFRRMSQKPSSPVRTNMTSFGSAMDGASETLDESRDSADSPGANSNVTGDPELGTDGADDSKPAETWHSEVGRRPIVVTPATRPKSNQGMLKSIPSLSPISAEEDFSPVEENAPAFSAQRVNPQRVASVHGEISHVDHE